MKVLSDATAARLLALLDAPAGGRRGIESLVGRRGGRAAPSTAPARMWQIHVSPESGDVTVDAGHAYLSGQLYEIEASAPGTANADDYVILAETADGGLEVSLAAELPDDGSAFAVIGQIREGAAGFFSQQFAGGPVYLSGSAHWGAAKPLTELPADADGSWEARKNPTEGETASTVAESSLIELELDEEGRVSAKRYRTRTFDTHGNLIAISDRTESATPDPGGEEEPDPCGNPLNEGSEATDDDWDNPLEGGGEAGDEEDEEESPKEWDNPLDHEGDGGFTPPCRKN